jgi:hypothetical protein
LLSLANGKRPLRRPPTRALIAPLARNHKKADRQKVS